ncbi:MAG TPA: ABC transporter [Treponema sp.]|nr:ABC transporter [Treponema sp.]
MTQQDTYKKNSDTEEKLDNAEKEFLSTFKREKGHSLRTLLGLYKGHYTDLSFSIVFFIIKHSPTWALPVVTANIINAATNNAADSLRTILINTLFMILFIAQNVPTNYLHTWLYAKTVRNVELELRGALVRKLQQLSISYHTEMQSGRLQSKIMRDVEQIETLSSQLFITMLAIILNITVSVFIVAFKSRIILVFFAVTIPVAVVIMTVFKGRIKKYNTVFRRDIEETSARVMEMVELIPVTRAHALENRETEKMDRQLEHVAKSGLKLDMIQTLFGSVSWVCFQIFQVICLAFSSVMASRGAISIGDVVMYQSYFTTIVGQISAVIGLLPVITKGLESVDSVGDILLSGDIEDSDKKPKLEKVDGHIELKNVGFSYPGSSVPVLEGINLDIPRGSTVAFVGGSGAGKSTILNLVIGFLRPVTGQVLIDGHDLSSINMKSYRTHLSVVPQQSILFTGTIRENITYGKDDISDERLREIIKAANLDDVIADMPDGLNTMVSEQGNNLSGGQKQRISIARAFIRDPAILILDEATSALDSVSEKKIQDAVQNLIKGRTTLIVAHRLSTIRNADHIAVIGGGIIGEYGTYDELMRKKGVFYRMHELQV